MTTKEDRIMGCAIIFALALFLSVAFFLGYDTRSRGERYDVRHANDILRSRVETARLQAEIRKLDGWKCEYCGKED